MGKTTLNNGQTGLAIRTAINTMTGEIYNALTMLIVGDNAPFASNGNSYINCSTDADINTALDGYKEDGKIYNIIITGEISIVDCGIKKYPNFNLIGIGAKLTMSDELGSNYKAAIFPLSVDEETQLISHNYTIIDGFEMDGNYENQLTGSGGDYIYGYPYGACLCGEVYHDEPDYSDTQFMVDIVVKNCIIYNFIRSAIVPSHGWRVYNIDITNSAIDHGMYIVGGNVVCRDITFHGSFAGALAISDCSSAYNAGRVDNINLTNFRFVNCTGDGMIYIRGNSSTSLYSARNVLCDNFIITNDADHPYLAPNIGCMILVGRNYATGEECDNIHFRDLYVDSYLGTTGLFKIMNSSNIKINGRIKVNKTLSYHPLIRINPQTENNRNFIDLSRTNININGAEGTTEDIIRFETDTVQSVDGINLNDVSVFVENCDGILLRAKEDAVYTLYNVKSDNLQGNVEPYSVSNQISISTKSVISLT